MNVKELKDILDDYDDNLLVVLADGDDYDKILSQASEIVSVDKYVDYLNGKEVDCLVLYPTN